MRTIYKHLLPIQDTVTLQLHAGAEPLHVGMQQGNLYLWALQYTERPMEERQFFIVGTGHPAPESTVARYIGTAVDDSWANSHGFVWHVFSEMQY